MNVRSVSSLALLVAAMTFAPILRAAPSLQPNADAVRAVKADADKAMKDLDREDSGASEQAVPQAKPVELAPAPPAPAPIVETPKSAPPPPPKEEVLAWNFETGDLAGWTRAGEAFDHQPTYGDNPTGRGRGQPSQHQGDYWIGTYENRSSAKDPAGQTQGDGPQGRLTSKPFFIKRTGMSFLVGGGCDLAAERVSLVVDGKEVRQTTGKCNESMDRAQWDVSEFIGKTANLLLVDESSGGWGHINFDDLVFIGADAAKVEAFGPRGNLALGKTARQSSTSAWSHTNDAQGGVDGVKNGGFGFHTDIQDGAWWEVDLNETCALDELRVFNRIGYEDRAKTLSVMLSKDDKDWERVYTHQGPSFGGVDGKPLVVDLKGARARYVRLRLGEKNYLHLDEIEVYGRSPLPVR
jgi:hypothetical protein